MTGGPWWSTPACELVSVTMPNSMHREVALATIAAGKHLWVEKPVGRGVEDTAAVAEAARRRGRPDRRRASATASRRPCSTPAT